MASNNNQSSAVPLHDNDSKGNNNNNAHAPSTSMGIPPIVIFSVCVAASAGMTMYTKRATSMLRSMEKVTERQHLRNPPRIGPPTKAEWEKLRPRWEDDDI